ncbi:hypothetical protein EAX61_10330 [Dokdonia sinensis]|uniref:Uncharacterized protein n=1 Tax=Dokdonia sinensis TaxID=2479847 RepID=A0A3M0GL37_9FLAO|nr:hypothetical protein [Dokdonia sinensis]RMB58006.1 hypothetical protein EAX61_10330 [Dokdonia sinensis]
MKKLLYIFCFTFGLFQGFGQSESSESTISLSVVLPDNTDQLQPSHISKMESKIQKMVSNYGISGQGYTNNFVIYPKYEIYDHTVVEGMKNVHVVNAEFNLFIKEMKTGKVFSIYSQSLKGDGYNRKQAVNQSISSIKTRNDDIKAFLDDAKEKIVSYYIQNCDQIYNDGSSLITQKRYREAIALLYSVPKEVGACYEKIRAKTDEAYIAYQDQKCAETIQKSQTAIAANNYNSALTYLSRIDPSSSCNGKSQSLIASISTKVDEKEREQLAQQERYRKDRKELARLRMANAKEIALAYYKSKPQTVIYKSLF